MPSDLPNPAGACNVVVLAGNLSSDPRVVELPSGDVLVHYELTVRPPGAPTASVPVVEVRAAAPARTPAAGAALVVVGSVRRRFFRAGGATRSSTEVLASSVTAPGKRATRLVAAALEGARLGTG